MTGEFHRVAGHREVGEAVVVDRDHHVARLHLRVGEDLGDKTVKPGSAGPTVPAVAEPNNHFENFIDCVRSRKREDLRCEAEEGYMSTALCHLANIAYRTGRTLHFDPKTETFPGDSEANALLTREYREPYTLPEKV